MRLRDLDEVIGLGDSVNLDGTYRCAAGTGEVVGAELQLARTRPRTVGGVGRVVQRVPFGRLGIDEPVPRSGYASPVD
jgi:hypothetical protein